MLPDVTELLKNCWDKDPTNADVGIQETTSRDVLGLITSPKLSYNRLAGIRFGTHSLRAPVFSYLFFHPIGTEPSGRWTGNPMTPRHTQLIANWIMSCSNESRWSGRFGLGWFGLVIGKKGRYTWSNREIRKVRLGHWYPPLAVIQTVIGSQTEPEGCCCNGIECF